MFGITTKRTKTVPEAACSGEEFKRSVEAWLSVLHLMDPADVSLTLEHIATKAEASGDALIALRLAAQESISVRQDLDALRAGVRMMGIDPAKLAEAARSREPVYPNILLGCVAPDPEALKARCGETTNLAGWARMWEDLKAEDTQRQ